VTTSNETNEALREALRRPLILASASPRRAELLRQVGWQFEVIASGVEENDAAVDQTPASLAATHARNKALDVSGQNPGRLTLGADTIVVIGERILGKPTSAAEAREMLRALSGRQHQVVTAVALALGDKLLAEDVVTTDVTFRELSEREIEDYVATGEPMDKAGAYGIQGRGALIVRQIRGCYFNVVGLPLARVGEMVTAATKATVTANSNSGDTDGSRSEPLSRPERAQAKRRTQGGVVERGGTVIGDTDTE